MRNGTAIGTLLATTSILSLVLLSYTSTNAQSYSMRGKTVGFGGRVLSTTIPSVTCTNADGTAPVALSSNLAGAVSVVSNNTNPTQNPFQRSSNIARGIYRMIPLYTHETSSVDGHQLRQPKPGDWILGLQTLVPNLSTCQIDLGGAPIPFPVVESSNFGVSQ